MCLVVGLVLAGCGSATGDSILFTKDDGSRTIAVMNADGTEVRQLTDYDDSSDGSAVWSPDSDSIAFTSNRDGDYEIFVMNVDGTEVRQLTDNDDSSDRFAVWSPDGDSIAFMSDRDGDFEIFVMNADGTGVFSTGQNGVPHDWGGPAD